MSNAYFSSQEIDSKWKRKRKKNFATAMLFAGFLCAKIFGFCRFFSFCHFYSLSVNVHMCVCVSLSLSLLKWSIRPICPVWPDWNQTLTSFDIKYNVHTYTLTSMCLFTFFFSFHFPPLTSFQFGISAFEVTLPCIRI